jgi:hypothetical protein
VVAVFKHSQHSRVQVFKDKFTFFVLANFIQIFDKKPSEKLLSDVIYLVFIDLLHDLLACASLVDNSNEVLSESQWNVVDRVTENVVHHMGKGTNQFIAASN